MKVWIVEMHIYSGTVLLAHHTTVFNTEELANKVADKLKEVNNNNKNLIINVKEVDYYESEQDVPILKEH